MSLFRVVVTIPLLEMLQLNLANHRKDFNDESQSGISICDSCAPFPALYPTHLPHCLSTL